MSIHVKLKYLSLYEEVQSIHLGRSLKASQIWKLLWALYSQWKLLCSIVNLLQRHFQPKTNSHLKPTPGNGKASTQKSPRSLSSHVTEAWLYLQGEARVSPQPPKGCGTYPKLSINCSRGTGITAIGPLLSPQGFKTYSKFPCSSTSLWRTFLLTDNSKLSFSLKC